MSKLQLNKLKLGIKNGAHLSVKLSSNMVCDSNDGTNFRHKLLLTKTTVSRIREAFANGSSTNVKLSKTQVFKIS